MYGGWREFSLQLSDAANWREKGGIERIAVEQALVHSHNLIAWRWEAIDIQGNNEIKTRGCSRVLESDEPKHAVPWTNAKHQTMPLSARSAENPFTDRSRRPPLYRSRPDLGRTYRGIHLVLVRQICLV
jgi:hypothetical protein